MSSPVKECMETEDRDINSVFDGILFCEERQTERGYQEGSQVALSRGNAEGYHLGYHRGAEIGAEIGYYHSIVSFHLSKQETNPELYKEKVTKQFIKIKETIETFPKTNSEQVDIASLLEEIRGNFRRICSLLKIDNEYAVTVAISF